ncbi:MAG TPA: helix-turn-helix domain-containing protein [Candidatus Acidoferrales bacterium]|nr:helix-turn-helix domain-containing protein [Candidatus Acidoferrales bacterium]
MPSTPFGDHLKREREMRDVSLEEISAATRISTRYLTALEAEQWHELPGGAFTRGFIRSVARFLGMNEDDLVAEYDMEIQGRGQGRLSGGHVAPKSAGSARGNWRVVVGAIVIVALAVLLAIGGWLVIGHYGPRVMNRFHRHPAAGGAH